MNDDRLYQIGISLIPLVGCITARNLVAYTGGSREVFRTPEKELREIPGIGTVLARNIANSNVLKRAEKELEFIDKHQIQPLFYLDKEYPERLKACSDAPVMLYVKGKPDLNMAKIISVVGTRNATDYGYQMVDELLSELGNHNYPVMVVSGLAYGIDIRAHRSALKNGLPTVGVLAHGLDKLYPQLHAGTAREMIASQGGLITDFISGSAIDRKHFIRRNRIIAGLADATIVVESAHKGGALVTAEIANSYNRDVFAFPGRKGDAFSEGCNFLIKSNRAALIESVKDLEYIMNWEHGKSNPDALQPRLFSDFTEDEKIVITLLEEEGPLAIDMLCIKSGLPMNKVSPLLLNLEFTGLVKGLPGKVFKLI
ncbi:DNA processing protein DprA [Prolixibacter bellariivorans]|uniref:DNA processing protein DprA n=1 Tax=Prolixibacter bellariivorans TaxID=314319 RepID=A0A5M4AYT3_9BACT|nr:DNA-processing protein DprA [Prolixibacter bellariivorans]GET33059.1 DNA processing protein DprA [Prolixibacter bellariivorans]